MNPDRTRRASPSALIALLVCASPLCGLAAASPHGEGFPEDPTPLPPPRLAELASAGRGVDFDEPGDGSLWTRGRRWKMGFEGGAATYLASFGPTQPHLEIGLSPDQVLLAGETLEFERAAAPERVDQRVELDRGAFVEVYALDESRVEQLFVFETLPRRGELVVRIPMPADVTLAEDRDGLLLRGPSGDVHYSRAIAIDASGKRVDAPTTAVEGAIVIRVDAAFVEQAELPLVIDPVLTQTWIESQDVDTREPDAVFDSFNGVWLMVYQETFSALDHDIRAKVLSFNGTVLLTGAVDISSADWKRPRIAYVRNAVQCLAVAEVGSVGSRIVRGRMLKPNGGLIEFGTQFTISGNHSGDKSAPTVGGDHSFGVNGQLNFCVAFQRQLPTAIPESEIQFVNVYQTDIITDSFSIPTAGRGDVSPSISRSSSAHQWTLAFQRNDTVTFGDIYAAYIHYGGAHTATFPVTAFGMPRDSAPCASSPLLDASRSAIVFERRSNAFAVPDVMVAAIQDGVVTHIRNINALEQSGTQAAAQVQPSIDSDGHRFIVSYSEEDVAFSTYNVFTTDLFEFGGTLGVAQGHVPTFQIGLSGFSTKVAAARNVPGGPNGFLIPIAVRQNDVQYDMIAVRFNSVAGGSWGTYCFGDNSFGSTPCPCAPGSAGNGCANSAVPGGAHLAMVGNLSVQGGGSQLFASGVTPNQPCLFFQGTTALAGAPFGSGLRCAGGFIVRLGAKAAIGTSVTFPETFLGEPALEVAGQLPPEGGMRTYQVWYRDPTSSCPSGPFNLTNGVRAYWAP